MSEILWDSELFRRYHGGQAFLADCLAPQRWQPRIGSFELLHALRDSRQELRPLALHLRLPFCANNCRHCQRVTIQGCDPGQLDSYLEFLMRELQHLACHLDRQQVVEQLTFSGGSPTLFGSQGLQRLMDSLQQHFSFSDSSTRDFCIDLDPRRADWSSMGQLLEQGFNRIALRVDDLDSSVQKAIDRPLRLASTQTLVEAARTLQFRSVGVELTRGLPGQTAESFRHSLERLIELQPDRLSLPEYHQLPGQSAAAPLPDLETRLQILGNSVERLQQAGYRYIGLDLFTLPDDDLAAAQEEGTLRLNLHGLSLQDCDLLGMGLGAISQVGRLNCQNHDDMQQYQQSLNNDQLPTWRGLLADAEDLLQQQLRQQLICNRRLNFASLAQATGIDLAQRLRAWRPRLDGLQADGLIELDNQGLNIKAGGVLLGEALCRLLGAASARAAATASAG
jgi:oxygen-independent coproporphyrinogen-3 oxidase